MMTTITFFNQLTAMSKRLAMVLTMLLIVGIGQVWGETIEISCPTLQCKTTATEISAGAPVTYMFSGNSNTYNPLRWYSGVNLTIKANDGYSITGIIITASESYSLSNINIQSGGGNISNGVWAGESQTVELQHKTSNGAQTRITKIAVTYTASSGGGDSGDDNTGGGGDCDVWKLVTDASDLKAGDQIVIAAKDVNKAIGKNSDNGNNRTAVDITKDNNNTITFGNLVKTITLGAGKKENTFAFEVEGDYLYAASSSSNYLKTKSTLDDNGSWTIAIASNGVATIKAQGTYTRNTMQYNNGSTLFACYASASQSPVCIYKYVECTAEPTVTLNPNGGTFASTPDGWNLEGNNYKKEDVTGAITLPTPTKTGYNFDGWYDGETKVNSSYTPSETVTLVANWTAKTTNITLNANTNNHGSGSDSSVKATYNQALPNFTPCTPATGYTLNGYFTAATSGTKIIDKDGNLVSGVSGYTSADGKWANEFATLTLYAQYVASQYTVTFDANGGTGTMAPQTFTHDVSQPLSANQFTREHYTFKGWTINQDGSGHLFEDQVSTVIPSSLTILYAQWTPIEYVIKLDANQPEGHVPSSTTTNAEGLLLPHAFPSEACKQDWTFAGWSETDVTEETTTAPTTLYTEGTKYNPTRYITLYAVFSKTDEAFGFTKYEKVTSAPSDWSGKYLISNGTQTATGTQFSKSALAIANFIPGTDEKTEYEFTISKNGNNENYYILSPDGTYYVGGTTGSSNKADLIFSDNPNEDKYLWNLSASDPMTKNNASDRYIGVGSESSTSVFKQYSTSGNNAECYLYKRIEETSSTTTYNSNPSCVPTHTITWMNGDDVLGQDKVEEGKTPEYAGDEPTKVADAQYTYTFKGWTPDIVEATADATYTATYTATVNKYTITWKNGETTLENDENVPYGTEPSYNGAPPTKAATAQYTYTFKGWDPEVTTVTGNATYTATFTETINKYQVTFNMNGHGTAPETQTIAYGSKVSEPSAPTADGYKFAGWYKDEQCTIPWNFGTDVITGNTTIHAKWLQIFTITWKANGLEYTTTNVTEGEPITPPASPDLGDYCGQVFAGWTTAEMEGTANVAPTLYPNPTPFPTATKEAPKTYYAVFADYED